MSPTAPMSAVPDRSEIGPYRGGSRVIARVVRWGWDSQGSSGFIPCPDTEPRLKTDALNPIHLPPGLLVAMTCFDSRPSPVDDRDIDIEESLSFTGREAG